MAEGFNEHRIYVGGIDPKIDLQLFKLIFSVHGEVCYVSLNERRRFGFVSYSRKMQAQKAIECFDGFYLVGSPLRVEWAYGWPREDLDDSDAEHLLAILRTQPEFQHFQQKTKLLLAVINQVKQKNPRVILLLRQNWKEFESIVMDLDKEDPLPPLVIAGTSPLGEDFEQAPSTSVAPRISQPQSESRIPYNGLAIASGPESVEPTEHFLAILRAQPEFQHFQRKSDLVHAVIREKDQENPRVLQLLQQNREVFQCMVTDLKRDFASRNNLPPLVVAGTSPLESSPGEDIERAAAPSTSVIPGISQLQSEPHIPHNGLAIASVPESVTPYGATNAQETEVEVRRTKRPKDQKEDQKGKKTKVDNKVEETEAVCRPSCTICMDEEVGVVFLPCGHLVSCPICAELIFNCPMCRKQITGKVRTYMS